MSLTSTTPHTFGRNRQFFSLVESTPFTQEKPATTDAAKVITANFDHKVERINRNASRATRSLLERYSGKGSVAWSVEAEVIPSGTEGTPPDLHPLYYAGMGAYANISETSDTYSLTDSQVLKTVGMTQRFADATVFNAMEAIWGAWVESMTITAKTGEAAKVKWEGGAGGYAFTGTSTLNGAMSAGAMIVQTADDYNFSVGSIVDVVFGALVGNYKVTGANRSTHTYTLDASVAADTGSVVRPYVPAQTTAGTPLMGLSGSITIGGGSAIPIIDYEVTYKHNVKPLSDEGLVQYPTDLIPGWREVTGKVSFRARKDLLIKWANTAGYANTAIIATIGNTAGTRLVCTNTYCELDYSALQAPETEEVMISLPFTAKGSSGADEGTVAFT